jgi:hypothetical protein
MPPGKSPRRRHRGPLLCRGAALARATLSWLVLPRRYAYSIAMGNRWLPGMALGQPETAGSFPAAAGGEVSHLRSDSAQRLHCCRLLRTRDQILLEARGQ